jgi:hypothetical protein
VPVRKLDPVLDIAVDVLVNVVYLLSVALVELLLRPAFGPSGVPPMANVTLLVMDMILLFSLVRRLIKTFDQCVRELTKTKMVDILGRWISERGSR